jgi:hypothetical protein
MQYYAPRTRHNIRSVTLSNSVLLVSPSPHSDGSEENQVVIQDSLVSAVPKLHRMNVLLKEHEWEEGQEDEAEAEDESFRAVSSGDRSYTPQWRGSQRVILPKRSGNGLLLKMLR